MEVELEHVERLYFADGSPVRAASAVTPLGDGLLIAQDDGNHAAWLRGGAASRVRLLPSVDGHDVFDEASGTKHLKPDLEAACQVQVDGGIGVLLLGSGSSPARMRSVLVLPGRDGRDSASDAPSSDAPSSDAPSSDALDCVVADLTPLYAVVAEILGVSAHELNMEGACVVGEALRWYQRGLPSAGSPSASVDLELSGLLAAVRGAQAPESVRVGEPHRYDLGEVRGVGLAVTDALALSGGTILLSTAAEDAPNTRDDGPVVGSALVLLEDHAVVGRVPLPTVEGDVCKVEGITVLDADADADADAEDDAGPGAGGATVLGVVDADDADAASLAVRLRVRW